MSVRLWFKQLLVHIGVGELLIEFCERCGVEQPLDWYTGDYLWMKTHEKPNGVLCPQCFDQAAERKGLFIRWKAEELK